MFTNDMMERTQSEIEILESIDAKAMEALIGYAYSGLIRITAFNVQSLLIGASFLQMEKVRSACCDFLKKRLCPDNVLGVVSFAESLSCESLVEDAKKFIEKRFQDVAVCEEFLSLNFDDIMEIISKDELHVVGEERVFEAVMAWVKKDVGTRRDLLPPLLTRVRLPLLTPEYLTGIFKFLKE